MNGTQDSRYMNIRFIDQDFPLSIHENRISTIDNANRNSRVFHEEVEIKYFYEGRATLMIDTTPVAVQAGDLVIINPYEFHSTVELDTKKGEYHLFMVGLDCFTATNPSGLNLRHLLLAKGIRFNTLVRGDEELMRLLDGVARESHSEDEYARFQMEALLKQFFVRLLRTQVRTDSAEGELNERMRYYSVIDPAVRRIHMSYSQKLTIDELAALCSVSKYHFCRIFKLATGQSAIQYLLRYRLKIAHSLLGDTDKSISEIAWQCGFPDENYFYRCYKKQYCHSPQKKRATFSEK